MAVHNKSRTGLIRSLLHTGVLIAVATMAVGCGGASTTGSSPSSTGSQGSSGGTGGGGGGGGGTGTNVRVQWDTSSVPNLAGYVVLHGTTSGTYFEDRWAGLSTTFDFPVSQSGVHYFAVKVKDTNGNESTASTEVSVSVP